MVKSIFLEFLVYLTWFAYVPIFNSISPFITEILEGHLNPAPPPSPIDSRPQNNPIWLGLSVQKYFFCGLYWRCVENGHF